MQPGSRQGSCYCCGWMACFEQVGVNSAMFWGGGSSFSHVLGRWKFIQLCFGEMGVYSAMFRGGGISFSHVLGRWEFIQPCFREVGVHSALFWRGGSSFSYKLGRWEFIQLYFVHIITTVYSFRISYVYTYGPGRSTSCFVWSGIFFFGSGWIPSRINLISFVFELQLF